ncbi:MAG TPA: sulfide/dihydroorotate dehydrogenase-like FAD/NAD-binding protein [Syntrophales bacterium]|nr:sulfide/dihydroorotate dehydrogenase-like FAD/NAD-binding protein [Syntrophales bacterium]
MSEITLTIDGNLVKAEQGDTVLKAARKAGIEVPTLCDHPALEPYGACRLCLVEIEGMRGYPPSCTTPAAQGMVVKTSSPVIIDLRKEVVKLLLSGHTSPCLVCLHREPCEKYRPRPFKSGKATRCTFCSNRDQCELRKLSEEYKIDDLEVPIIYKHLPVESMDPFMDRDYNLCVLCGRCARICEKIHTTGTIAFVERGKEARISTAFDRPHTKTDCRFCGACVDICPTGAMSDRYAKWYGAPDRVEDSNCILCPVGCSVRLKIKDGKVISSGMTAFTREARICAVGRFVLPQLLDSHYRHVSHQIRVADGLIRTSYDDAIDMAANSLKKYSGSQFAMIAPSAATREELYVLRKFTKEVMKSDNFVSDSLPVPGTVTDGTVKALYSLGDYLQGTRPEGLDVLIVSDMFPSRTEKSADVVFAVAGLVETDGTFLNASGQIKTLSAAAKAPNALQPDWKVACDIAKKMGASGFDFQTSADIASVMAASKMMEIPPVAPEPSPLEEISAIPRKYRGHAMSDIVSAMRIFFAIPEKEVAPVPVEEGKRFKIVEKIEIVPNTYMVTVHAPVIAEKCQPGQFVIAMVKETSERIPYTISDFDREKGTVTMVTLETGRSSRELANTRAGEYLAHFAGPLGRPVEVKKYGTVVLGGGCFGVGAILPIARAMKEAGNRVICIEEASSHYLLHWQDKLSAACDELIIVTKDGSAGMKGGVQEAITMLADRGEKIDQAYIIGCTFMMMLVCDETRKLGIPTMTAMNPLMVDGTGMCGCCRVSVGGVTKFSCVDGPFLDGLQIDWIELMQRQAAFKLEEVEAIPQDPVSGHDLKAGHACMSA